MKSKRWLCLLGTTALLVGCAPSMVERADERAALIERAESTLETAMETDDFEEFSEDLLEGEPSERGDANDVSEPLDELVYDATLPDLPGPEDLPIGQDYLELNDNVPLFTNEELELTEPFQSYEPLDEYGRVGVADALLDVDLMPSEQRGSISNITPTGWNQGNYDVVSGKWLYNRSHLIGHQLTGYDGKDNLITGTRQFNVDGMLPFENFVANVVEEEDMQVRYRITPVFEGENLLAHGIVMEGFSMDDNGETLSFNIFVPNQQGGITLDYATGNHSLNP